MQEKKLRMISETEIPLAILYASLEQYCNPKYQFKELMDRKSLVKDVSEILAQDTEDLMISAAANLNVESNMERILIPETNNSLPSDFFGNHCPSDGNPRSEIKYTEDIQPEKIGKNLNKVELEKEHILSSAFKSTYINFHERKIQKYRKFRTNENDDKILLSSQSVISETYTSDIAHEQKSIISASFIAENSNLNPKTADKIIKKHTSNNKMAVTDDFVDPSNLNSLMSKMLKREDKHSNRREKQEEESDLINIEKDESIKGESNRIEMQKKRKNVLDIELDGLEQLRKLKKENNQVKNNEWGFKKSQNKIIDFDLDSLDIDIDRPKQEFEKNISSVRMKNNENSTRFSQKKLTLVTSQLANDRLDVDIQLKSNIENNTEHFEDKLKNWSSVESSRTENSAKNRIQMRPEIDDLSIIRPNSELAIGSQSKKAFKKIQKMIPNRIPSSDIMVWKPED